MQKLKFICTLVREEIVLLSDGRITTCCFDAGGRNTFSNIYEDDFEESVKKLRLFKEKLTENPGHFPQCSQCFISKKRSAHSPYNYFLKENPSQDDIDGYLNRQTVPHGLVIEVTSACNMTCIGCPTGLRNRERKKRKLPRAEKTMFMDMGKLKMWIAPYMEKLKKIRLFNYGEPLLHPGTIDFCSFLTRRNPGIDLVLATNLLPLDNDQKIKDLVEAQPSTIIVSLHGSHQEGLVKYMGEQADFQRALEIMKKIIAHRNDSGLTLPVVIWKYILFDWNDSDKEMEKARILAGANNIDYLGFEITGGKLASKRFYRGSKEFEKLKDSEFFITNIYKKIAEMKVARNVECLK